MRKGMVIFSAIITVNLCQAWQVCNLYEAIAVSSTQTELVLVHSARESMAYVNGGIAFTYPVGTFTLTPKVYLTVELLNATYNVNETYVPIIISNDATATTVRVNKVTANTVVEAATDDVTVNISASGYCDN